MARVMPVIVYKLMLMRPMLVFMDMVMPVAVLMGMFMRPMPVTVFVFMGMTVIVIMSVFMRFMLAMPVGMLFPSGRAVT